MRFAVDVGGTFTDLVVENGMGQLYMFKAPTTPEDPVDGVLDAFRLAGKSMQMSSQELLSRGNMLIHGTTHAINAVITGRTARTALLVTEGHKDILFFREGGRHKPFDFRVPYPKPYIPRSLTFEVPERVKWDGETVRTLDEEAIRDIIREMQNLQVEAVAVCLLWSVVNPSHEKRIGELLDRYFPGVPYTLSHLLNPILREYRRASSTAMDASLKPIMSRYLGELSRRIEQAGFSGRVLMLTSKGGVMDVDDIAAAPIHAINSGPSMAPIAGRHYASKDTRSINVIIADAGGTTYDVSLVRQGSIPINSDLWIGEVYTGYITGFPSVDVRSIGAGGGSIAWLDRGGLLRVGPMSAGASPGPACYGSGGERPTVTDACVVLGYIDPDYFLGGRMKLDVTAARQAIETYVGKPLRLDLVEAASAIHSLCTQNMVGAIEQITVQQGVDPRGAVLVAGGGAAGLNSVAIARQLGCRKVVIPDVGAALSAAGALISHLYAEFRSLSYTVTDAFDYLRVNETLSDLVTRCNSFIANSSGGDGVQTSIDVYAEARYRDQIWEIDVPVRISSFASPEHIIQFKEDFDAVHETIFGFKDTEAQVEIVSWRACARCKLHDKEIGKLSQPDSTMTEGTRCIRKAWFKGLGMIDAQVTRYNDMPKNAAIDGPAIVESPFSSIVLEPGVRATKKTSGSLIISLRQDLAAHASSWAGKTASEQNRFGEESVGERKTSYR